VDRGGRGRVAQRVSATQLLRPHQPWRLDRVARRATPL
jgi:hypothetical protein